MQVRPIRPDDKERLLSAFERSSRESRYRRFFSPTTGLSAALLYDLAARAREEGIERFSASVLAENEPIMKLFRGFGVQVTGSDQGVVELLMDLPDEGIPEPLSHAVRAVASGDIQHKARHPVGG